MKNILVVDDEPKITQLVRDYLERAGFGVMIAHDGMKALSLAKTEKPDAIILDLGLPHLDGLDFTREFRKTSNAPIIMLTARSEESDKLIGLELGADDYMTKPFSPKELVARIRVAFRRIENATSAGSEMIRIARQPGRVFTRAQLLDAIHGVAFESYERAIDAHIKNIRRKVEVKAGEPKYILTVYGVGYKFVDK
jgi:DNA-binding response OmpR family regulator